MGYANPLQQIDYSWNAMDFGVAADVASSFKGPKGLTGRIREITAVGSEVFTTGGAVLVGTTGDPDAYAMLTTLLLPATDTLVATKDRTGALIAPTLPADTQIEVIFQKVTAAAGGTGIANVTISVDWF